MGKIIKYQDIVNCKICGKSTNIKISIFHGFDGKNISVILSPNWELLVNQKKKNQIIMVCSKECSNKFREADYYKKGDNHNANEEEQ